MAVGQEFPKHFHWKVQGKTYLMEHPRTSIQLMIVEWPGLMESSGRTLLLEAQNKIEVGQFSEPKLLAK